MWTVLVHTLKESIHRRIALALIVVAVFFLVLQLGFTHFERNANGELMVRRFGAKAGIAARTFVLTEGRPEQVGLLAGLWVTLGLFAATPLLTSFMEKGWVELLLSKGTSRWQVFAGRFMGCVALFVGTAFVMNVISVCYFSIRAGVPLKPYFIAVGLISVSFLSILALLALVATAQPNAALLVIVVFLELIVSGVLRSRQNLYELITAKWAQWCLDWLYRVLPKHEDLERMARNVSMGRPVESWFPLWTTAIFFAVATAWAFWRFERKAF
jgi:ABC-type transport system involved in multi-copper enzyme maturation permease subunit